MIYKGNIYSTLADVPVDLNDNTCQQSGSPYNGPGYLSLPFGWAIAENNAESIYVTAAHYWSTNFLAFSDGNMHYTLWGGSNAGFCYGNGGLSKSGSTYSVNYCSTQILITRKLLPV